MGSRHKKTISAAAKILGNSEPYDLIAFGSHYLDMSRRDSDVDLLVLTRKPLRLEKKHALEHQFKAVGIDPIILSKSSFRQNSPSFILSAPLECISRYGETIKGKEQLRSRLSDKELQAAMYLRALFSLGSWDTLETKSLQTKLLSRASLILWNLEDKVALGDIYSLGHFFFSCPELKDDKAWDYLERSGLLYAWLEPDFEQELSDENLRDWAQNICLRMKAFLPLLEVFRGNQPLPRELMEYQAGHTLYRGLEWVKRGSLYKLKEGFFNVLLRLSTRLNKAITSSIISQ